MKRQTTAHLIDLLFPLALFCAFALTSLLIVMIGADVYRRTTDDMERNFAARTPLSYLSQALHRGDFEGGASLGFFGEGDALILREQIGGEDYATYLYCYEGSLCELFIRADVPASPENGQAVTGCASLTIEQKTPGLFLIRCVSPEGTPSELLAGLRSSPPAAR